MIPTKKCAPTECDAKYVLKVWLYGVVSVFVLGSVGVITAGTAWKKDMEYKDIDIDKRLSKVEQTQAKIDSIYTWVKPK